MKAWKVFVKRRRPELAGSFYPCALPSSRAICPRHRIPVGPVTEICKNCHDELHEQLAAEFSQEAGDR